MASFSVLKRIAKWAILVLNMVRFKASKKTSTQTSLEYPHPPRGARGGGESTRVREFFKANGIFISWAIPKSNSLATRDSTCTRPNICRPAANTRASRCMWGKTSKAQGRRLLPDQINGPIKLLILVIFARVGNDRIKTISHRVLRQTADGSS